MQPTIGEPQMKFLMKEAFVEVLEDIVRAHTIEEVSVILWGEA